MSELMQVPTGDLTVGAAGKMMVFNADFKEFAELMKANVGTGGLSRRDLAVMKVPAGSSGLAFWPVVDDTGRTMPTEFLDVIVLHHQNVRRRYTTPYGEGESGPPACSSEDCRTGIGDPGGDCASCAFSKFGSSDKEGSNAQGCTEYKLLFVLRGENMVPEVIQVPPTSLVDSKKFFLGMTSKGIHFSSALIRLGLVPDKANGTPFFRVSFTRVEKLSPDQTAFVKQVAALWKPMFTATAQIQDDMQSPPPSSEQADVKFQPAA